MWPSSPKPRPVRAGSPAPVVLRRMETNVSRYVQKPTWVADMAHTRDASALEAGIVRNEKNLQIRMALVEVYRELEASRAIMAHFTDMNLGVKHVPEFMLQCLPSESKSPAQQSNYVKFVEMDGFRRRMRCSALLAASRTENLLMNLLNSRPDTPTQSPTAFVSTFEAFPSRSATVSSGRSSLTRTRRGPVSSSLAPADAPETASSLAIFRDVGAQSGLIKLRSIAIRALSALPGCIQGKGEGFQPVIRDEALGCLSCEYDSCGAPRDE
eukprot:m51a1_g13392 hypothetical protein (269) ;mRNA; f:509-2996